MEALHEVHVRFSGDRVLVALCGEGRLLMRVEPESNKLLRKTLDRLLKSAKLPADTPVSLLGGDGSVVGDDLTNDVAWRRAEAFAVGGPAGVQVPVRLDPPRVQSLQLPRAAPRVGIPMGAAVLLESASLEHSAFRWFRSPPVGATDDAPAPDPTDGWTLLAAGGPVYTPTVDDVGCRIAVECVPYAELAAEEVGTPQLPGLPELAVAGLPPKRGKGKSPAVTLAMSAVAPTPEGWAAAFADRLGAAETAADHARQLRVVSYNILEDHLCNNAWSLENLYPFCDQMFVDIHYRAPLIVRELFSYDADVVCLQEVSRSVFDEYLLPTLGPAAGLEGRFADGSDRGWGLAVFFRGDRFEVDEHRLIDLSNDEAYWASHRVTAELCEQLPNVGARLAQTQTIGQLVALRDRSCDGRRVAVINLHLYSHPMAGHIRTIQVATVMDLLATDFGHHAVIMCGDFNTTPGDGAVRFAEEGSIAGSDPEWAEANCFDTIDTTTKEKRGDLWHAVLHSSDYAAMRAAFARLDPGRSGCVPRSVVTEVALASGAACDELGLSAGDGGAPSSAGDEGDGPDAAVSLEYPAFVELLFRVKQALQGGDAWRGFLAALDARGRGATTASAEAAAPLRPVAPAMPGAALSHSAGLRRAGVPALRGDGGRPVTYCAGREPSPCCVDHVFFTAAQLEVVGALPSLAAADVYSGIPSEAVPSDHLSVVLDLAWRAAGSAESA